MTLGCCPICGYDRSGGTAERCPECGTTERPEPEPERLTPTLRRTLYAAAVVGLMLYFKMAAHTYRCGVEIDWEHTDRWLTPDRVSRLLLTGIIGALAAAALLVWRRPDRIERLPSEWETGFQLVLGITILTGILGLFACFNPIRRCGVWY